MVCVYVREDNPQAEMIAKLEMIQRTNPENLVPIFKTCFMLNSSEQEIDHVHKC